MEVYQNNHIQQTIHSFFQKVNILDEEFDQKEDKKFVNFHLVPYLKDLFKDLCSQCKDLEVNKFELTYIDKATFLEYC